MLPEACKSIARLVSDSLDRPLTASEWLRVRVHLPICRGCRNFRDQIALLRTAGRSLGSGTHDGAP
ncbi:zf-HC2 domain-containing protein [Burkholderia pyrrocinia]|uniref:zf-HC2 domain-containing protein n=1 Tax=Burkholderia sp. IT-111MI5 TaxID=3026439 RepID=UPI002A2A5248|nr:zf-HC2 domain-containing protein [Burkholderia pyrrocinia]EKS9893447.1 zf-HC2 domain-containing protein [Burkholderia pyrrocinia]EKS9905621.1 zf-HC2 domain-containing protein [Burkholderia pyrrocinia]